MATVYLTAKGGLRIAFKSESLDEALAALLVEAKKRGLIKYAVEFDGGCARATSNHGVAPEPAWVL